MALVLHPMEVRNLMQQATDPCALLQIVDRNLSVLDLAGLLVALRRLGEISPRASCVARSGSFLRLMQRLHHWLQEPWLASMDAHDLASAATTLAHLRHADPMFLQALTRRLLSNVSAFTPPQLSQILLAFHALEYRYPPINAALVTYVSTSLRQFTGPQAVELLEGFCHVGLHNPYTHQLMGGHLELLSDTLSASHMQRAISALACLRYRHQGLLQAVARRVTDDPTAFASTALAQLFQAFRELGFRSEAASKAATELATRKGRSWSSTALAITNARSRSRSQTPPPGVWGSSKTHARRLRRQRTRERFASGAAPGAPAPLPETHPPASAPAEAAPRDRSRSPRRAQPAHELPEGLVGKARRTAMRRMRRARTREKWKAAQAADSESGGSDGEVA